MYRRGRWARGSWLSIGAIPNIDRVTRVGLRTRRGLKGAVVRNRLKRQIRAIVDAPGFPLPAGLDLVIVIHPKTLPAKRVHFEEELRTLCRRIDARS